MTGRPPPGEGGFTLVELLVSLGLFALIAVAGVALVDSIIGIQARTATRLDRLDAVERTMFVLQSDLDQVTAGPIAGGGGALSFRRVAPGLGGVPIALSYRGVGPVLVRAGAGRVQPVIAGVAGVRFTFFDGARWVERWPPAPPPPDAPPVWPRAVALEMRLTGTGTTAGLLRRVVALPAAPELAQPAERVPQATATP